MSTSTLPSRSCVGAAPAAAKDEDGVARLLHLAALAEEFGANSICDQARELAARVSEGRFYVACVGQFKRGKSTLINALIGRPLLPVGFLPVTTVPTVIRFAERTSARVRTHHGSWRDIPTADLREYVSEEHNPQNAKGVLGVEVFAPSPLLASGMCLVDTPGLGSVFARNTSDTHALIPHIDAALLVAGADPPLAGEELALVEAVAREVRPLIVVLNKADRTAPAERAAAAGFTMQMLARRLRQPVGPMFEVSAAERLEGSGPERDWPRLVAALRQMVEDSGQSLVRAAYQRGLGRLSERLLAGIREEREAYTRPLEESERRIAALKETLARAERSRTELGFLWMAEQQRLADALADRQEAFLSSAVPDASREFGRALRTVSRSAGPSYRRRLMRAAQDVAGRHVLPWLEASQRDAEQEYQRAANRFVTTGNDFLRQLAEEGIREFALMPQALDPETGFRVRSAFTFRDLIEVAQPASPLRWLADLILGLVGAHGVIQADAREFLERLLEVNCTRVQSDVLNRIQESRSRLQVEIRNLLLEVQRRAEQALSRARAARNAGAAAVEAELLRMDALERRTAALRSALAGSQGGLEQEAGGVLARE
ncbi:MAG TPA: dynamin family protein [Terriglobia bacterium]